MLAWTRPIGSPHDCLELDGRIVAMLIERNGGGWLARLEAHRPITAPVVTRQCTSLLSGRRGCELWAERHIGRLRAELAAMPVPVHRGAGVAK